MAFEITRAARSKTLSGDIRPQIVLEVDGHGFFYGSSLIEKTILLDDGFLLDDGWFFDSTFPIDNQKDLLTLEGTTQRISQQLLQDEGGTSSTTNVVLSFMNGQGGMFELLNEQEIISRKAAVWLGLEGTAFPEDFIRIFNGNITQVAAPPGKINLTVSHPDHLKRAELFQKINSELTDDIDNSQTSLPLLTTEGLLLPGDALKTYIRIDDEIIEYTGISSNTLTGLTRGALGTTAVAHDNEATVESFYRLEGQAIELALKLLISGSEEYWVKDLGVASTTTNSFVVETPNLNSLKNVRPGDLCKIEGTLNNVAEATVFSVLDQPQGTLVTLTSSVLVPEGDSDAVVSFKSRYNVLNEGVGLEPDQVDIAEFEETSLVFSSSIPEYDFYIKDTINGKDLINTQILFPAACFSLPRKGRVSLGRAKPPLLSDKTITIDENSVLNAARLQIERSSLENFFNSVVYKYDPDTLTDRFLQGRVTISATSLGRIKTGNKPYVVESLGLRPSGALDEVLARNSRDILERFQFGADYIRDVQVPFSVGWNLEVGDTVIVEGLQLYDAKRRQIGLEPRVFEVQNRSFNIKSGQISLALLDTTFSSTARYGVITPSSQVGVGSTASRVIVKKSYGTSEFEVEQEKWLTFVGAKVLVHSEDWSIEGVSTLIGFDPNNQNAMLLDPPLAFVPGENYIVQTPNYDEADSIWKATGVYFSPTIAVTGDSMDGFSFEVDRPDEIFVGSQVVVHSFDYSVSSVETVVTEIVGDMITVEDDLGIVPLTGFEVRLVGFVSDEGLSYRYF